MVEEVTEIPLETEDRVVVVLTGLVVVIRADQVILLLRHQLKVMTVGRPLMLIAEVAVAVDLVLLEPMEPPLLVVMVETVYLIV